MFDEIDSVKEERIEKKKIEDEKNFFEVGNITNKEIGSKIKVFSKIFLKIQMFVLAMMTFFIFMGTIISISETGPEAIFVLFGGVLVIAIWFVIAYYFFLIISGFGALVEDINSIKESTTKEKNDKKSAKTKEKLSN